MASSENSGKTNSPNNSNTGGQGGGNNSSPSTQKPEQPAFHNPAQETKRSDDRGRTVERRR